MYTLYQHFARRYRRALLSGYYLTGERKEEGERKMKRKTRERERERIGTARRVIA
jgi:hypothetical protein